MALSGSSILLALATFATGFRLREFNAASGMIKEDSAAKAAKKAEFANPSAKIEEVVPTNETRKRMQYTQFFNNSFQRPKKRMDYTEMFNTSAQRPPVHPISAASDRETFGKGDVSDRETAELKALRLPKRRMDYLQALDSMAPVFSPRESRSSTESRSSGSPRESRSSSESRSDVSPGNTAQPPKEAAKGVYLPPPMRRKQEAALAEQKRLELEGKKREARGDYTLIYEGHVCVGSWDGQNADKKMIESIGATQSVQGCADAVAADPQCGRIFYYGIDLYTKCRCVTLGRDFRVRADAKFAVYTLGQADASQTLRRVHEVDSPARVADSPARVPSPTADARAMPKARRVLEVDLGRVASPTLQTTNDDNKIEFPWGKASKAFQVPRGGPPGEEGVGEEQMIIIVFSHNEGTGYNKVWLTGDCLSKNGIQHFNSCVDKNKQFEHYEFSDCLGYGLDGGKPGALSKRMKDGKPVSDSECHSIGNFGFDGKICTNNRIYLHSEFAVDDGITTFTGSHKFIEGTPFNQCSMSDKNFPGEDTEAGKFVQTRYYDLTFNADFTNITSFDVGVVKNATEVAPSRKRGIYNYKGVCGRVKESYQEPGELEMIMKPVTCSHCEGYCFPEEMGIKHCSAMEEFLAMKEMGINRFPWGQASKAFQGPGGGPSGEEASDDMVVIVFSDNKVWITADCLGKKGHFFPGYGKSIVQLFNDCRDRKGAFARPAQYELSDCMTLIHEPTSHFSGDGKLCEKNRVYLHPEFIVNGDVTTFTGTHKFVNGALPTYQCSETDTSFPPEDASFLVKTMYFELSFNKDFSEVTRFDMGLVKDATETAPSGKISYQLLDFPEMKMLPVTCSPCEGYCFSEDLGIRACTDEEAEALELPQPGSSPGNARDITYEELEEARKLVDEELADDEEAESEQPLTAPGRPLTATYASYRSWIDEVYACSNEHSSGKSKRCDKDIFLVIEPTSDSEGTEITDIGVKTNIGCRDRKFCVGAKDQYRSRTKNYALDQDWLREVLPSLGGAPPTGGGSWLGQSVAAQICGKECPNGIPVIRKFEELPAEDNFREMAEAASEYVITSAGASVCDHGSRPIVDATSCRAAADALGIYGLCHNAELSSTSGIHGCHSEYGSVRYNSPSPPSPPSQDYRNSDALANRNDHCKLICKQAVVATPVTELTGVEAIDGYAFIGAGHCCRGTTGMGTGLSPAGCRNLCDMSSQCISFTHSSRKGTCKLCPGCNFIEEEMTSKNRYSSWKKTIPEKASRLKSLEAKNKAGWLEVAKSRDNNKAEPAGEDKVDPMVSDQLAEEDDLFLEEIRSLNKAEPVGKDEVETSGIRFLKEMHSPDKTEPAGKDKKDTAASNDVPAKGYAFPQKRHKAESAVRQIRILQKNEAKTAGSDQVVPAERDEVKLVQRELSELVDVADATYSDESESVEEKPAESEELEPEAESEQQGDEQMKDSKSVRALPLIALLVTAAMAL